MTTNEPTQQLPHSQSKRFQLPESNNDLPFDGNKDDDDDTPRPSPKIPFYSVQEKLPPGTIGISKSAIRDITGYSYMVKMPWHITPVKVNWQAELIDSDANVIVVDGSRQG